MVGIPAQQIAFSEKVSGHIGTLIINGLVMPRTNSFDPLVKIWTTIRKRIFEKRQLDVVGIFVHDTSQELISCNFYLSYTNVHNDNTDAHTKKFEESFPRQMKIFEETLLRFLEDEDGYDHYTKLLANHTDENNLSDFFNAFLKKAGVRTKGVERHAHARNKQPD